MLSDLTVCISHVAHPFLYCVHSPHLAPPSVTRTGAPMWGSSGKKPAAVHLVLCPLPTPSTPVRDRDRGTHVGEQREEARCGTHCLVILLRFLGIHTGHTYISRLIHANMLCVLPVLPMRTCCAGSVGSHHRHVREILERQKTSSM